MTNLTDDDQIAAAIRDAVNSMELRGPGPDLAMVHRGARSRQRRRGAAAAGAAVALGAAALVIPSLDGPGTTPSRVGFANESPAAPYGEQGGPARALDVNGCPEGTTVARASDDSGATAVVRAADDALWLCSGIAPRDGTTNFFSGRWDEYALTGVDTGTWLQPLTTQSCDGTPCTALMWSAVGTVPAGVSTVSVQVAGDPEPHQAAVTEGYWAIRLQRPATDNTRGDTTSTISGDTLVINVEFAWQDEPDTTDKRYLAVNDEFRAMCKTAQAAVTKPTWNELAECTDELLQHNLNTTALDYESAIRYDAGCEWYAELLVAVDTGQTERAAAALARLDELAQWSGYVGTGFDIQYQSVYEAAVAGDLSPIRQIFPTGDEGAGCRGEYLDQAEAWTP